MMRGLLLISSTVPLAFALLATTAIAQEEAAPQNDWMLHMDRSTGAWRYVPDRPVLVPGGVVQLMVFGDGGFSVVLDDHPDVVADILDGTGTIRTAELRAPDAPGDYAFHDKYHPEARGVLVVREREPGAQSATAAVPTIGVVPGGYESAFAPARLEVAPGAEVRFTANGTFGHNLQAVDGGFSAGDLAPGGAATFTAPATPGEHPFECRFHKEQGMVGVLVVAEAPPTSADPAPAARESAVEPADREVSGLALGMGLLTLGLCASGGAAGARRKAR